jgi:hypothetical protein
MSTSSFERDNSELTPVTASLGFNDGANKGFWRVQPRQKTGKKRGRWIEMGAELRAYFKNALGEAAAASGRAIGSDGTPDGVRVYITGQADKGIPDGIYGFKTKDVMVAEALLPDEYVEGKGLASKIPSDIDVANLPRVEDLERVDITPDDVRLANEGINTPEGQEMTKFKDSPEGQEIARLDEETAATVQQGIGPDSGAKAARAEKPQAYGMGNRMDFVNLPDGTIIDEYDRAQFYPNPETYDGPNGPVWRSIIKQDGKWFNVGKSGKAIGKPLTVAQLRDKLRSNTLADRGAAAKIDENGNQVAVWADELEATDVQDGLGDAPSDPRDSLSKEALAAGYGFTETEKGSGKYETSIPDEGAGTETVYTVSTTPDANGKYNVLRTEWTGLNDRSGIRQDSNDYDAGSYDSLADAFKANAQQNWDFASAMGADAAASANAFRANPPRLNRDTDVRTPEGAALLEGFLRKRLAGWDANYDESPEVFDGLKAVLDDPSLSGDERLQAIADAISDARIARRGKFTEGQKAQEAVYGIYAMQSKLEKAGFETEFTRIQNAQKAREQEIMDRAVREAMDITSESKDITVDDLIDEVATPEPGDDILDGLEIPEDDLLDDVIDSDLSDPEFDLVPTRKENTFANELFGDEFISRGGVTYKVLGTEEDEDGNVSVNAVDRNGERQTFNDDSYPVITKFGKPKEAPRATPTPAPAPKAAPRPATPAARPTPAPAATPVATPAARPTPTPTPAPVTSMPLPENATKVKDVNELQYGDIIYNKDGVEIGKFLSIQSKGEGNTVTIKVSKNGTVLPVRFDFIVPAYRTREGEAATPTPSATPRRAKPATPPKTPETAVAGQKKAQDLVGGDYILDSEGSPFGSGAGLVNSVSVANGRVTVNYTDSDGQVRTKLFREGKDVSLDLGDSAEPKDIVSKSESGGGKKASKADLDKIAELDARDAADNIPDEDLRDELFDMINRIAEGDNPSAKEARDLIKRIEDAYGPDEDETPEDGEDGGLDEEEIPVEETPQFADRRTDDGKNKSNRPVRSVDDMRNTKLKNLLDKFGKRHYVWDLDGKKKNPSDPSQTLSQVAADYPDGHFINNTDDELHNAYMTHREDIDGGKALLEMGVIRTTNNQYLIFMRFTDKNTGEVKTFYSHDARDTYKSIHGERNGLEDFYAYFTGKKAPLKNLKAGEGKSYFGENMEKPWSSKMRYWRDKHNKNLSEDDLSDEELEVLDKSFDGDIDAYNAAKSLEDYRILSPEDRVKLTANGEARRLEEVVEKNLGRQLRKEVPSFYEAFDKGDRTSARQRYNAMLSLMPDNEESRALVRKVISDEIKRRINASGIQGPARTAALQRMSGFVTAFSNFANKQFSIDNDLKIPYANGEGIKVVKPGDLVIAQDNMQRDVIVRVYKLLPSSGRYQNDDFVRIVAVDPKTGKLRPVPADIASKSLRAIPDGETPEIGSWQGWDRLIPMTEQRLGAEAAERRAKALGIAYNRPPDDGGDGGGGSGDGPDDDDPPGGGGGGAVAEPEPEPEVVGKPAAALQGGDEVFGADGLPLGTVTKVVFREVNGQPMALVQYRTPDGKTGRVAYSPDQLVGGSDSPKA